MSALRLILVTLLATQLAACSYRIKVDNYPTGQEEKLSALSTYCWSNDGAAANPLAQQSPVGGHHRLFDSTIRATVESALAAKGYHNTDCAHADFNIDYRLGLHTDVAAIDSTGKDTLNDYGPKWKIGDDNSVSYEGLVKPKDQVVTVQHGTLHVGAFTRDNRILWHSSAEKTLNDRDTDEQRRDNIAAAVNKVMAGFPGKH